ncbi:MAG TPA: glycosyltransferase [Candidatus Eisenbacteria bacterium]
MSPARPSSFASPPPGDAPLVSVLLATRNGARFLRHALAAVEAQTYRPIELIAVDDGSEDETGRILEEFASRHPWARVIRAAGIGPAGARALAFASARGPLIAIHDDDDDSAPDRFERQVATLRARPDVGALGSAATIIDERGEFVGPYRVPITSPAIRRTLRRAPPFVHGSVMMRREAYEAAGGFRAPFRCAEDYDLWLRIPRRYGLANLPQALYRWRSHPGNSFAKDRDRHLEFLAIARAFAAERRARGTDSIELLASAGDPAAFRAMYPGAARLALYRGEAFVREGRVAEGRAALGAAFRSGPTRFPALAWWLLSWAVAASPRARRRSAARALGAR